VDFGKLTGSGWPWPVPVALVAEAVEEYCLDWNSRLPKAAVERPVADDPNYPAEAWVRDWEAVRGLERSLYSPFVPGGWDLREGGYPAMGFSPEAGSGPRDHYLAGLVAGGRKWFS